MQDFIKHINAQLANFNLTADQMHKLSVTFASTNDEAAFSSLEMAAWWAAQAKEDKRTRANRNARRCFAAAKGFAPEKIKDFSF